MALVAMGMEMAEYIARRLEKRGHTWQTHSQALPGWPQISDPQPLAISQNYWPFQGGARHTRENTQQRDLNRPVSRGPPKEPDMSNVPTVSADDVQDHQYERNTTVNETSDPPPNWTCRPSEPFDGKD
jgi:hypothetical protein